MYRICPPSDEPSGNCLRSLSTVIVLRGKCQRSRKPVARVCRTFLGITRCRIALVLVERRPLPGVRAFLKLSPSRPKPVFGRTQPGVSAATRSRQEKEPVACCDTNLLGSHPYTSSYVCAEHSTRYFRVSSFFTILFFCDRTRFFSTPGCAGFVYYIPLLRLERLFWGAHLPDADRRRVHAASASRAEWHIRRPSHRTVDDPSALGA